MRRLRLHPPLEFDIEFFALSPDGARAALAGPVRSVSGGGDTTTTNSDTISARVIDLATARSTSSADADVESAPLAAPLFTTRPGLRLLQVGWHPRSPSHVALLTSDSVLRLYRTTACAVTPEQVFDLVGVRGGGGRLGLSNGGGGGGARGAAAAAFAFGGDAPLWERFTLYVVAADGALFSVCPVAPFGSALPGRVAGDLVAAAATGDAETRAWVQRALPDAHAATSDPSTITRISPHTLDEHAPAVAGPLPVSAPVGVDARSAPPPDTACAVLALSSGPGALALLLGTVCGRVAALAVTGDAGPAWCASPPRAAPAPRGGVAAVKLVCRSVGPVPGRRALLLDVIDGLGGGCGGDDDDDDDPPSTLLLPDPDAAARAYAVRGACAYAIDIDWLPALAVRLAGGGGGAGLPRARARGLRRGPSAQPAVAPVAATVVTAPPTDGGLLLLLPGGKAALARCARPAGAASAAAATLSPAPAAATHPHPSPALARVLASAPQPVERQPLSGEADDAATPAGAAALAEGVAALTAAHLDFGHAAAAAAAGAGADLLAAAKETTAAAAALREKTEAALKEREASLTPRVRRAAALQANLEARARLLARLMWSLPRPPTLAEAALARRELPALDAAAASVAADVSSLARRAAALHLAPAPPPPPAVDTVPPAQLARARAAAAEAAAVTARAARRLAEVEAAVADAEAEEVGVGLNGR